MVSGIYCYIDLTNNKIVYIGKDSNIDKNIRHKHHLSPSHYKTQKINQILQNNPNRYCYKILEKGQISKKILNALEMVFIKKYNPIFNFTAGGDGGLPGFKHSQETKIKMSRAQSGLKHPMYGIHHTNQHKKNLSQSVSKAKNNSGFFRVSIYHTDRAKQGFKWRYMYMNKNKRKSKIGTTLIKLKNNVIQDNLPWYVLDEEKAKRTCKKYGYNYEDLK